MKAAIIVLITILSGCFSAPDNTQPPSPDRRFFDLGASSTVGLGPCHLSVDGGRLVVRINPDGSQTVEDLDIVLGDCSVGTVHLTNNSIRLGVQADEANSFATDILISSDLMVDTKYYPLSFPKLRVNLTISDDGATVTATYPGCFGSDLIICGLSVSAQGVLQ